jgi:peptidoglycan hydrolase-like protein with peptidoglycan-binding domain
VADERASESWHFDYPGELKGVLQRLGYEQWALCGALLVGHGDLSGFDAEVQALLCRAGFDIGAIDGKIGPKTRTAVAQALGVSEDTAATLILSKNPSVYAQLLRLPAK